MQQFLPDDYDPIPVAEIEDCWQFLWRAFNRLSPDRPWYGGGMGPPVPGALPWLLLTSYAEYHNYDADQSALLHYVIPRLDVVYIAHHQQKARDHG